MSWGRHGTRGLCSTLCTPFFLISLHREEQQVCFFTISLQQCWLPLQPQVLFSRVDVTEDGIKALVTLSNGDMRRALNILQVQTMAMAVLPSV